MDSIIAVFGDENAARQAVGNAREAGFAEERFVVSIALTMDDVGAEAPGQSYGNQVGQDAQQSCRPEGSYADAVRAGGCVVTVEVDGAADAAAVRELLLSNGARYLS